MKKLIELRKCLLNVVVKLIGYNKPIPILNPNAYLDRIRLEYNIFDMKVDLYRKCFSSLNSSFKVEKITAFTGLNPIPRNIKLISLTPFDYVFLDNLHISKAKFSKVNPPNRISINKDRNHLDVYSINNFKFSNEFKPLVKEINFEIHKIFLKDNIVKFDLRPYHYGQYSEIEADYYICNNCDTILHKNNMNPNDHLVCSISCGLSIRGMSYSDFV